MYMLKENHGSEIFREYLNSTIQPQLLSYKLTDMGVTYGNVSWPALSDTVVGSTGLPQETVPTTWSPHVQGTMVGLC